MGVSLFLAREQILNAAAAVGLSVTVAEDWGGWSQVLAGASYIPCAYTPSMIDYQAEYLAGFDQVVLRLPLLLWHDRKLVGAWPLLLRQLPDGGWRLGSNEGALLPPMLRADLAASTAQKISRLSVQLIDVFTTALPVAVTWSGREEFCGGTGVSEWASLMLGRGLRPELGFELYVDLRLSFEEIWSRIRRSYRSLINTGGRLWQVACVREAVADVWREFRALHLAVAGRVTRSDASWDKQLAAMQANGAFLITLRDAAGRLVGGGFFHVSAHEGFYSVGAYDRSLFDKPLGHVVQIAAIREMQERDLRWYRIGNRAYPQLLPTPSQKEISIAEFKEGFSTHVMPRITFESI